MRNLTFTSGPTCSCVRRREQLGHDSGRSKLYSLSVDDLPRSEIRDGSTAYRVLVVDDDRDSADVLSYILAQAGYDVRIALDAAEAFLTVDHFAPDVALIDIGLPMVTGYELAASIRARPELEGCRFIATSGYVGNGLEDRSKAAGFEAHLTKPVSVSQILTTIEAGKRKASGDRDVDSH
jgi:CheY-like chemotaxis protein